MAKEKKIRQYARITLADWYKDEMKKINFDMFEKEKYGKGDRAIVILVYLGEIPNMQGHCVVAGWMSGRVYSGFHTENFREMTMEDEE